MTIQELNHQADRVTRFKLLDALAAETHAALQRIENDYPDDPGGDNPFTTNTRESRTVINISVEFSPTKGGAAGVVHDFVRLNIPADELGQFLASKLRARLKDIDARMEVI